MKRSHRSRTRVLTAMLFLAGACIPAWAQRPYGLDTSHWNGSNINWSVVYSNGYRFVFTKASESTWYTDDTLHHNMANARAAGLLIGPYHFARPEVNTTLAGATNEANWFVSVAGQYMTNGFLRPVLDLETGGPELGISQLSAWANAFCNRVKQLKGVSPIIYCNVNYAQSYLNTSVTNWDLWIAHWPNNPDPQNGTPLTGVWGGRWTFWQYAGDVSGIPGVPSSTDLNVFNGTLASLQSQIIGGGTNPPAIAIQPASQTVASNTTASFTVVAYGGGTLSYQWQKNLTNLVNGGRISGATSATLTISAVDGTDAGTYRCIVTSQYGSITSSNATLTVVPSCDPNPLVNGSFEGGNSGGVATGWTGYQRPPYPTTVWSIQTASPPPGAGTQYQQIANTSSTGGGGVRQNVTGCMPGATYIVSGWMRGNSDYATCRVKVSPSASTDWSTAIDLDPPQYTSGSTWKAFSGTVVATGTNMTIWLDGQTGGSGLNKAECFDAITVTCGSLPPQPPEIHEQPLPSTNCPGTTATFSISATGSGTLSYRWQKNQTDLSDGGHYSGTTTPTLTISPVDSTDAGNYSCRVNNAGGWTNSIEAALTVLAATTITQQPTNQSVAVGGTVTFTVAATGEGPLSYQWQKNQTNLVNGGRIWGVNTPTLAITNAQTTDSGNYRCVVTAGCGSATSFQAALTVGCGFNPLTNPSFEGGSVNGVGTGWTGYQRPPNPTTSWSLQTASPPPGGGTKYQQIANTSSTGGGGVRQDITGCTPGSTYRISGWMRGNSSYATCRIRVSPTASTSWSTAVDLNPPAVYSGSTWTAFSGTVVATSTNMTLWLDGQTGGTGLNKAECFDAITISCE